MNVKQTIRALTTLPPKTSVLLEANHGLGKSSVVAQAAALLSEKTGKSYDLIDFRLAQMEVGDLIGMMKHVQKGEVSRTTYKNGQKTEETRSVENVSIHDLADWFPTDPDSCGILFLDEITRAQRDVLNCVFELALDYKFHFKSLPIGWRVVAACNDNLDIYTGTQMDPALYSRFLKIKFKPDLDEWFDYAQKTGVHKSILSYLHKFDSDLGFDSIPEPGKITPDPRSWCKLSECFTYSESIGENIFEDSSYLHQISMGFIGNEVGMNFVEFCKKNYKVFKPEDFLNNMTSTLEKELSKMVITDINFYSKEIIEFIKKKKEMTKTAQFNLFKFFKIIPKECASDFWSTFSKECPKQSSTWYDYEEKGKKVVAQYTLTLYNKNESLK